MSRILFTSSPGLGHVHPMVPLAAALADRAHDVRWAVAAGVCPRLHAAGYASELAAPIAAARLDVPNVTHGFGAVLPEWRVAAASDAVASLWRAHGLEPRPYGGSCDHLYVDIYPPTLQDGPRSHLGRARPLRPVPFDAVGGESDRAPQKTAGRRRVYVTFGTLFNDIAAAFSAAVAGVAGLDVDVLVTVGPEGDPAALGVLPTNVRVERYVPQTAALPGCAAVVSHAGSGTFLAALGLGIPQLCMPQAAGQFVNARRGAAAGAALALDPTEVSAEAVAGAVRRLLDDASFAAAVRSVAAEIAAMPAPDQVAAVIEGLL